MLLLHVLLPRAQFHRIKRGETVVFCPVCHDPQKCNVTGYAQSVRQLFMTIEQPKGLYDEVKCGGCGLVYWSHPGATLLPGVQTTSDISFAAQSSAASDHLLKCVEEEEHLRRGTLDPQRRTLTMNNLIGVMEYDFKKRTKGGWVDAYRFVVVLTILATALVGLCAFADWSHSRGGVPLAWGIGSSVLCAAGIAGAIDSYFLIQRRIARKRYLPLLASALAPFEPTEAEVAMLFASAHKSRLKLGRALRMDDYSRFCAGTAGSAEVLREAEVAEQLAA